MKDIIVGTDFSECSINALKHATAIAEKIGCDIVLLWVEKPGASLEDDAKGEKNYREKAEKKLITIADSYKSLMSKENRIIPKIRQGKPATEISKEAEKNEARLIVVGSHGNSGFEEGQIGSNAYRTVMAVKCPVLTVQYHTNFSRALTDIVLVVDSTEETLQKVPFTVKIAKLFAAKIHILGIVTSNIKGQQNLVEAYLRNAEKYVRDHNIRFSTYIKDSTNAVNTIIDFTKEVDANLIVIMSEQSNDMGVWLGSQARDMINKSKSPVLCIHPDDKVFGLAH